MDNKRKVIDFLKHYQLMLSGLRGYEIVITDEYQIETKSYDLTNITSENVIRKMGFVKAIEARINNMADKRSRMVLIDRYIQTTGELNVSKSTYYRLLDKALKEFVSAKK